MPFRYYFAMAVRMFLSKPRLFVKCDIGPGSFLEVTKMLPILTSGAGGNPAFHVIAPSLPNFGFSGVVRKPGFNIEVRLTSKKLSSQIY
jgi:hypothetical protein